MITKAVRVYSDTMMLMRFMLVSSWYASVGLFYYTNARGILDHCAELLFSRGGCAPRAPCFPKLGRDSASGLRPSRSRVRSCEWASPLALPLPKLGTICEWASPLALPLPKLGTICEVAPPLALPAGGAARPGYPLGVPL